MFCVNCGLELEGRFCAGCGTPASSNLAARQEIVPLGNWREEVQYATLLRFSEVRKQLANVQPCAAAMTGEEWMALYDKAFKPLTGVSVQTIAKIAAPIYAKLGVKTGKKRTEAFEEPPGQVIVDVLRALAKNGLPLVEVHQGEVGVVIEAKLPSDLWALEGQVVVTVEWFGTETRVEAATNIAGQLFDWGKSTRCLQRIFGELHSKAA